ncbi:programmed cell death protein 2 [Biscogniauxia mediterranea]|nr:programmed cell death protein 2 [Biscogniauxia mediterranea]
MPPYDSDSSEGEEDGFTETNVLLGYASKDPADDSITRLGGQPDWLDEASPPSAALARCKICKDIMVLLLQLDGELPDRFPGHERRLYVFACRKKGCRRREGSIRALRGVRIAPGSKDVVSVPSKSQNKKNGSSSEEKPKEQTTKPAPPSNLGETLFGAQTLGAPSGPTNPFSTNPFSTTASSPGSNPFASANNNPFSSSSSSSNATTSPAPPTQQPATVAAAEATKAEEPTRPDPESTAAAKAAPQAEPHMTSLPKTFAETLSLNNPQPSSSQPPPPEPWPPLSSLPKPYPISYLSEAEYETLDALPPPASSSSQAAAIQMDVDSPPSSKNGSGKGEDREVFESTMDAAFQRFADRVSQNPEQCIRYEFGGQPLLYSRSDAVGQRLFLPLLPNGSSGTSTGTGTTGAGKGMPRCGACGAPRAFEVQLCPRAIVELEADDEGLSLEDGMDWGTVIVGVCERDCAPPGIGDGDGKVAYVEEWAGVQWEELGGGGGPGKSR